MRFSRWISPLEAQIVQKLNLIIGEKILFDGLIEIRIRLLAKLINSRLIALQILLNSLISLKVFNMQKVSATRILNLSQYPTLNWLEDCFPLDMNAADNPE